MSTSIYALFIALFAGFAFYFVRRKWETLKILWLSIKLFRTYRHFSEKCRELGGGAYSARKKFDHYRETLQELTANPCCSTNAEQLSWLVKGYETSYISAVRKLDAGVSVLRLELEYLLENLSSYEQKKLRKALTRLGEIQVTMLQHFAGHMSHMKEKGVGYNSLA